MDRIEFTKNISVGIEKERLRLGITQAQMAKECGLSLSAYKKIINGDTTHIDLFLAYSIYRLTGKYIFELCAADTPEARLLDRWRLLSDTQKRFVSAVADFEAELTPAGSPDSELVVMVPVGNCEDGMLWDSCTIERVALYSPHTGDSVCCGIKITSNHLHPAYFKDDVLLIDCRPPRDGDVGIFVNRNTRRGYIRKYIQGDPVILKPVTHYGETFTVNPNDPADMAQWLKFGVVLTKVRQDYGKV